MMPLFLGALISAGLAGCAWLLNAPMWAGAFAGWGLGMLLVGVLFWFLDWRRRREPEGQKSAGQKFCRDCGKALVMFRSQNGFDPKTGRPNLLGRLRCPDWSLNKTPYDGVDCGNRTIATPSLTPNKPLKVTVPSATLSNLRFPSPNQQCHTPVRFDCRGCLRFMVQKGILSPEEADQFRS